MKLLDAIWYLYYGYLLLLSQQYSVPRFHHTIGAGEKKVQSLLSTLLVVTFIFTS